MSYPPSLPGAGVQVPQPSPCSTLGLALAIAGQVSWEVLGNEELDKVPKTGRSPSQARFMYQ